MQMVRTLVKFGGDDADPEAHFNVLMLDLPAGGGDGRGLVTSKLRMVTVPAARLAKAKVLAAADFRPEVVLANLFNRVRDAKRFGLDMPTVDELRPYVLGLASLVRQGRRVMAKAAAKERLALVLDTEPTDEVKARRSRERKARDRRVYGASISDVAASVADRVTYRLTVEPEVEREARVAAEKARKETDTLGGVALPRPGTVARAALDMMMRPEGVTQAEFDADQGLEGKNWNVRGAWKENVAKFGLGFRHEADPATGKPRFWLWRAQEQGGEPVIDRAVELLAA